MTFSIINFIRGDLKKKDLCVDKSSTTWRPFTFASRIRYSSPFFTVSKRPNSLNCKKRPGMSELMFILTLNKIIIIICNEFYLTLSHGDEEN